MAESKELQAAEANRSLRRIAHHLFPLGDVMRGRQGIGQLHGKWEILGIVLAMATSSYITSVQQRMTSQLSSTLYLRDVGLFKTQLLQLGGVMMAFSATHSAEHWVYARLGIVWRKCLTDTLHSVYLGESKLFYHLQVDKTLTDAGERITADAYVVAEQMSMLTYTAFNTVIKTVVDLARLAWLVDVRYVAALFGYLLISEGCREFFIPALKRGRLAAVVTKTRGEYRHAQSLLLRNADAIASPEAIEAQEKSMANLFSTYLSSFKATLRQDELDWTVYLGTWRQLIEPTVLSFLMHYPILTSAKVVEQKPGSSGAVEGAMKRNASLLGETTFVSSLLQAAMLRLRGLIQMRRSFLSIAGNASRITELLDALDTLPIARVDVTRSSESPGKGLMGMTDAVIGGGKTVAGLTFSVQPGEPLLVSGAEAISEGKPSLFHCLAGLHALDSGSLQLPKRPMDLMVISGQSPYMAPTRFLIEQLAYPHISSEQIDAVMVKRAMQVVHLEHLLIADEHNFESLPLKDKAKLCVARCLIQSPKCVALLDVDLDGMSEIFTALDNAGVTVVTVVRCPTPIHLGYHQKHLQLTGEGEWSLEDCDSPSSPWVKVDIADDDKSLPTGHQQEQQQEQQEQQEQERQDRQEQQQEQERQQLEVAALEPSARTHRRKMPSMSTVNRLRMMYSILLPSWSPFDGGMFLVIANIVFTCTNIYLTSTVLSALPGQLQAQAVQQNTVAYARLVGWATAVRFLRCALWQVRERCHHNCGLFFRNRLTTHIHKRYFAAGDFWRLHHLDGRIPNADVVITEDVWAMGRYVAWVINALLGPVFETVTTGLLLVRAKLPFLALVAMYSHGILSIVFSKVASPDFARLIDLEQTAEGKFRTAHHRLAQHAENVAFLHGEQYEQRRLNVVFETARQSNQRRENQKAVFHLFQSFLFNRVPFMMQQALRLSWSLGFGTDEAVMAREGGTALSAEGDHVEALMGVSFQTVSQLLSNNESFRSLVGAVTRLTNLLLVLEEIAEEREREGSIELTNIAVRGDV